MELKRLALSMYAASASAVRGPMPGIVINNATPGRGEDMLLSCSSTRLIFFLSSDSSSISRSRRNAQASSISPWVLNQAVPLAVHNPLGGRSRALRSDAHLILQRHQRESAASGGTRWSAARAVVSRPGTCTDGTASRYSSRASLPASTRLFFRLAL